MENTPQRFDRANPKLDQALARITELETQIAAHDATRRAASDDIQRMIQRLEGLHNLDLAMLASSSLETLASLALDHIVKLIPCYRVSIGTVNLNTREFFALAIHSQEATAVPSQRSYVIAEVIRNALLHAPYTTVDNSLPTTNPTLQALYEEGIHTILSVGLRAEGELIGLLNFHSQEPNYFTEEHCQIAVEIATQLAIGVHKAILNDALALQARRLDILHTIDLALIQGASVEVLVNSVCGTLREFFKCEQAGAVLFDYTTREMIMFASNTSATSALDKGKRYPMQPEAMEELTAQKIVVMEDFQELPADYPKYRNVRAEGMRSSVSTRMMFEGEIIGLLVLNSTKPRYFTPDFQQIAAEVSDQLAIAIHQKQLADMLERHIVQLDQTNQQIQRYNIRLETLHQLDRGIITATDIQSIVTAALDQIRLIVPCQQAGVLLFDFEAHERIVFSASLDAPSGLVESRRGPLPAEILDAVGTDKVTVVDDIQALPDSYPLYREIRKEGMRASLRIRLVYDEQVLGLLVLNSTTPSFFNSEYREIASEIGDQFAIAIYHKRITDALARHSAELELRVAERTAELRVAKEQVEAILDYSADGLILLEADMTIQKTNAAFCRLFQCQSDAYLQQSLARIFPSDAVELIRRALEDEASPVTNERVEVLARREDGTEFDAEVSVGHIKYDGLVCIIRDVTVRKVQERQLRYHASVQQNMNEAVIATDMDLNIQSWNKAAERIYGWSESEVLGRTVSEIVRSEFSTPEGREQTLHQLRARGWWEAEIVQHRKDGSPINTLGSVTLVHDSNRQPLGMVAVNRDISERKRAEDAMRLALDKEKELGDLKSRFLSMASHEFRNPLAAILATTEALTAYRQRMTDAQIDVRLGKIQQQVVHLNGIMENFLHLGRMQTGRLEFHPALQDLDALCRESIDAFHEQAAHQGRILYECPTAPVPVALDRRLMQLVSNNLVSNALKYSPNGKPVLTSINQSDTDVVLRVQDQGIGIPVEDLKYLFEPFHRATNVGAIAGTGLGLNIAKQAVEMHSGTITVESQVNVGTTFIVTLPKGLTSS